MINPPVLNLILTNRLGSLAWVAAQDIPWLTVSPGFGTLGAGGAATTVSLTPNVLASNLAASSYTATLVFTNLSDQSVVARQVTLAMAGLPVITSQPTNLTVSEGMTASFSVGVATNALLTYQWQFNNGLFTTNLADSGTLSGSATSALTISHVSVGNAGLYSVIVSNIAGVVTSVWASLTVTGVTVPAVTLETLCSFITNAAGGNVYGAYPIAGLLQAQDGYFYGTARAGGAYGLGTVFRWATNGGIGLIHAFRFGAYAFSNDGKVPYGGLIQDADGYLYGTAWDDSEQGTVFQMTTDGDTTGYSLDSASSGCEPLGACVQGKDGNFYGTASGGGADRYGNLWTGFAFGYGTVFQMTQSGVLTALGSFNGNDGANPASTLVQAADGNFYGTAQSGGTNGGFGTIFKITPAGAITALHSFASSEGANPIAGLTLGTDGSFYGTTYSGGAHNAGTVFNLAPDGTFTCLYSFTGGSDGSNCYGGLLLASDGNFYGTTEGGGAYGLGTAYRISREGVVTSLASFDGYQGAVPECTLIQATDGNLYGTTHFGGAQDYGAIFRISLDGPLQITEQPQSQAAYAGDSVTFSVATFGALPVAYQWLRDGTNLVDGGSVLGSNARLLSLSSVSAADAATYSVEVSNSFGGLSSTGAVLQVNQSAPWIVSQPQSQTVLAGTTVTFPAQASGNKPLYFQWQENGTNLSDGGNLSGSATPALTLASVVATNAGTYSLVITNSIGSITSSPVVLTVLPVSAPGTSLIALQSFGGGSSPFNPYAGVIQGTDGGFYGTTLNGGSEGFGSVFGVLPSGFGLLHSFTNGADGAAPLAGLVQASDGNFYGAASPGATSPFGTLFELTPTGAFTPLYSFTGGADGGNPIGSLVPGSGGMLYGTASTGGSNGFGTVFSLSTNGVFTPLWSFRSRDGSSPAGPLLADTQGQLYGTTTLGGSSNLGTVFRLGTNGVLTSLASFDHTAGAYPSNGVVQAADGSLYGTASAGGTNGGWGTVFRLTPDGKLAALHSFNHEDGAVPVGGLVWGTDGNLYGTTSQGGVGGQGTVFQITTNGLLTTLFWFNGANGANPQGTLIQARDGSFYGTAEFGGNQYEGARQTGDGLVFQLTLPIFLANPLTQAVATVGLPYSASLSTNAATPAGDVLTFVKVSGPAWLSVAADGTLSGTPAVADIGANIFTVSLADTNGWSSTASMTITVVPLPSISITAQGTNLVLNWSGGQPPYSVQMATGLASPAWQTIAGPMTSTTLLVTPTNAAAFYRIQGQ